MILKKCAFLAVITPFVYSNNVYLLNQNQTNVDWWKSWNYSENCLELKAKNIKLFMEIYDMTKLLLSNVQQIQERFVQKRKLIETGDVNGHKFHVKPEFDDFAQTSPHDSFVDGHIKKKPELKIIYIDKSGNWRFVNSLEEINIDKPKMHLFCKKGEDCRENLHEMLDWMEKSRQFSGPEKNCVGVLNENFLLKFALFMVFKSVF